MQLSFLQFIRNQLSSVPPFIRDDLTEKTVIVVGANSGIGYETAKYLATLNPGRIILACRSQSRGEDALTKLKAETGCKTAELWLVDLTSFASVNKFCERFNAEVPRLDLLIENAAVLPSHEYPMTDDDWETTFQTNNLSSSLLAFLLLPKMRDTAEKFESLPRLVVVSSEMHYFAKLDEKLIDEKNPLRVFGSMDFFDPRLKNFRAGGSRYEQTKLLNVLCVRAMASRLGSSPPIIVDAANPGFCLSNLRSPLTASYRIYSVFNWVLEKLLAHTSEEGARQVVWVALGGEKGMEHELNGAYVSDMSVQEPSDFVLSDLGKKAQDKLWGNLIEELTLVNPKVQEIVGNYLSD